MKKLLLVAAIATGFVACNNSATDSTTVDRDTSTTIGPDNSMTTTTTKTTYTPAEGDATYRNGNVMVWKNGDWVAADNDVTLDDGIVVYKNGEVKKDSKTVRLEDGEVVSRSGRFFDKTGDAIEDAWDATKRGVNKAGDAVKDAANDVKESVDNDHKH